MGSGILMIWLMMIIREAKTFKIRLINKITDWSNHSSDNVKNKNKIIRYNKISAPQLLWFNSRGTNSFPVNLKFHSQHFPIQRSITYSRRLDSSKTYLYFSRC